MMVPGALLFGVIKSLSGKNHFEMLRLRTETAEQS
jgi:hypothetical protein